MSSSLLVVGGAMRSRKSVNVPGVSIKLPSVTEKDRRFIEWAVRNDVDFIAHSFVRSARDVAAVQEILDAYNSPIKIISKIENQEGLDNIDEIIEASYGIMVARGDLGVELPAEAIPNAQRRIVEKCICAKRPVIIATQMLLDFYPHPRKTMPGHAALAAAGFTIGGVSSLVGLGGGSMSVPFLRWCGVEMRQAVGTSAAISWPIAISGTVGFIIVGWGDPQLPAWSLGYVSLPATLGIACSSVFFAPLGAKLAHSLPVPVLRRFFAVFLYVTAGEMLWNILH